MIRHVLIGSALALTASAASHRRFEPRFLESIEESDEVASHLRPHTRP